VAAWERLSADAAAEGEVAGEADGGSRLLPLVARNLEGRATVAAAVHDTMRATWAENQRLLEEATPVLRRLDQVGVPLVLLKGIALAPTTYPSLALRPIGDVDVLVGPDALAAARAALEAVGFAEVSPMPAGAEPHLHSFGYRRFDGLEIDLHAYALMECCSPGIDDELIARARWVEVHGLATRVPAAEDHLLLLCVHGLRWSGRPTLHWAADACTLLDRAGPQLRWPLLVESARRRALTVPLRRGLLLLRDELDAPVPEEALRALAMPRAPLRERLEAAARMRPPSLLRGLLVHWCALARAERSQSAWRRLQAFPGYLREMWGLSGRASVPLQAVRRGARRLAPRGGRA
jgi:hypothetical protein